MTLLGRRLAWPLRRPPRAARTLLQPLNAPASRALVTSASAAADAPGAARGRPRTAATRRIQLTPEEAQLFDFLLYIQHVYAPRTRLRVAGGWVRDKLRGAESQDIDVVLDNMRGKKFAGLITTFQRQRRLPASAVGIVKANSDKSKHLEVATVTIDGLAVDLVHLRSEEYAADSRIPSTAFATPEEDAARRDLTINALFYNLHTREVEDLTGRGLADLDAGVVRTPLEPRQTFMDDPLRVLRAVRFACAFGYSLDPALASAVRTHGEIKEAMQRKVSRERIGIEVRKMLSGPDPARALRLLDGFGLLPIVFNDASSGPSGQPQALPVPAREWTSEVAETAVETLRSLQESRLALASHRISFVEASGAVLSALFLPSTPAVEPSAADLPAVDSLSDMDEDALIACAMRFVTHRDATAFALPQDEMVEMLKTNVKWPKPAAKRAALIVEAVATFPTASHVSNTGPGDHQDDVDHQDELAARLAVTRFMWMTRYNSVLAPAVAILVSRSGTPDPDRSIQKALLELAGHYAKGDAMDGDAKRRRVDGRDVKARLGQQPGPEIARALSVLHVWEALHPDGTVEAELAFLERLAPNL